MDEAVAEIDHQRDQQHPEVPGGLAVGVGRAGRVADMGAFSAVQTLAMAAGAATMGPVIDRLGIWRSIVTGVSPALR